MNNEDLNILLYRKISDELNKYRNELFSMNPEEILRNAYEYSVKEDILYAFEENDLQDKQAEALLKAEHPLQDIYDSWQCRDSRHMDDILETIQSSADGIIRDEFLREQRSKNGEPNVTI